MDRYYFHDQNVNIQTTLNLVGIGKSRRSSQLMQAFLSGLHLWSHCRSDMNPFSEVVLVKGQAWREPWTKEQSDAAAAVIARHILLASGGGRLRDTATRGSFKNS